MKYEYNKFVFLLSALLDTEDLGQENLTEAVAAMRLKMLWLGIGIGFLCSAAVIFLFGAFI